MRGIISCTVALLILLGGDSPSHAQEDSYAARIVNGSCNDFGVRVAELAVGELPVGEHVGAGVARPVAYSFTTVDVPFDELIASEHAIISGEVCGEIGGPLNTAGHIFFVLAGPEGDSGVAYVNPNGSDATRTDVALYLAADAVGLQAVNGGAAPGDPDAVEPTPAAEDENDERSAADVDATVEPEPTETPAREEPSITGSITIYVVRCPLALVGDGSTDACEGNPIAGTAFRVARPLTDASTPLVPTNANGLVSIRFDDFPPGDTLRVVQELPADTDRHVAYCLDEEGTRLRITYPALPGLDPSLGVTDVGVRGAQDIFCDWFNAPTAPPAAPTPVPASPTPTPIPLPPAPDCDPSYPTLCLPSFPDVECWQINATSFPVYPPDPHRLDGDFDGLGCEPAPVQPPPDPGPPAAGPQPGCDPSYPSLCLSPGSPDLDCGEISASGFPVVPPDPHGFDGDFDGVGCE